MNAASKEAIHAAAPWIVGAVAIYLAGRYLLPKLGEAVSSAAAGAGKVAGDVASGVAQVPYAIVNGVGAGLSGDDSWTLGGWLYDITHDAYDPNAPANFVEPLRAPDRQTVTRTQSAVNQAIAGTDNPAFWGEWS